MSGPAFWANTPVRFSHLKAYGRSAAHGAYARIAPKGDETYAIERGSATHAILFGTQKVIGYPGTTRRGKEYEKFVADHPGHIILTKTEYDKSMRMADAVMKCQVAEPFLRGVFEETLYFDWMGLKCRATPDVRGAGFLTELKTSQSSHPDKFLWQARRMGYHAQMRFQEYACERSRVERIKDHWIVCVESEAPHPVTVFHVEPEALEEADKCLTLWAERLKACEAANHFPGYIDCAVPLMWPKDDFELEFEEAA